MFILPVHFIAANFHNNLSSKEESLPADFLSPSAGYIRASMQLKTNWWQDFLWLCVTCFRTWREMGGLSRACFTFLLLWSLQFVLIAQWYSSHLKKQSLPLVTSEYKYLLARMKNVWTIKKINNCKLVAGAAQRGVSVPNRLATLGHLVNLG